MHMEEIYPLVGSALTDEKMVQFRALTDKLLRTLPPRS